MRSRQPVELKQARSGLWDQDQSDPHMNAEEGSAWIVDIKLTPHSNKLVTGSFKRLLKLYETQNFEMCGSQDMEHAPMSIDVFYSSK